MPAAHLITNQQHGFLPGRSCITQLIDVLDNWFQKFDSNICIDVIYLDMAKAFDLVLHKRLLSLLKSYGINDNLHKWIESFPFDTKQRTCINGYQSLWAPVTSGIPQGSVLGPVLFLIFINNLPDHVKLQIRLFADENKICPTVTSSRETSQYCKSGREHGS